MPINRKMKWIDSDRAIQWNIIQESKQVNFTDSWQYGWIIEIIILSGKNKGPRRLYSLQCSSMKLKAIKAKKTEILVLYIEANKVYKRKEKNLRWWIAQEGKRWAWDGESYVDSPFYVKEKHTHTHFFFPGRYRKNCYQDCLKKGKLEV